jgi:hypothetical protein
MSGDRDRNDPAVLIQRAQGQKRALVIITAGTDSER